jgi:hypothetical protein
MKAVTTTITTITTTTTIIIITGSNSGAAGGGVARCRLFAARAILQNGAYVTLTEARLEAGIQSNFSGHWRAPWNTARISTSASRTR